MSTKIWIYLAPSHIQKEQKPGYVTYLPLLTTRSQWSVLSEYWSVPHLYVSSKPFRSNPLSSNYLYRSFKGPFKVLSPDLINPTTLFPLICFSWHLNFVLIKLLYTKFNSTICFHYTTFFLTCSPSFNSAILKWWSPDILKSPRPFWGPKFKNNLNNTTCSFSFLLGSHLYWWCKATVTLLILP